MQKNKRNIKYNKNALSILQSFSSLPSVSELPDYLPNKSIFIKIFLLFCCFPLKSFNLYSYEVYINYLKKPFVIIFNILFLLLLFNREVMSDSATP